MGFRVFLPMTHLSDVSSACSSCLMVGTLTKSRADFPPVASESSSRGCWFTYSDLVPLSSITFGCFFRCIRIYKNNKPAPKTAPIPQPIPIPIFAPDDNPEDELLESEDVFVILLGVSVALFVCAAEDDAVMVVLDVDVEELDVDVLV